MTHKKIIYMKRFKLAGQYFFAKSRTDLIKKLSPWARQAIKKGNLKLKYEGIDRTMIAGVKSIKKYRK